jgi:hypothetical protein
VCQPIFHEFFKQVTILRVKLIICHAAPTDSIRAKRSKVIPQLAPCTNNSDMAIKVHASRPNDTGALMIATIEIINAQLIVFSHSFAHIS